MPLLWRLRWLLPLLAALVVIPLRPLQIADLFVEDLQRPRIMHKVGQDIVLVTLDSEDDRDDTLHEKWRLPSFFQSVDGARQWRWVHAAVIRALTEARAKVVIVDLFFEQPSKADSDLAAAIRDARTRGTEVILCSWKNPLAEAFQDFPRAFCAGVRLDGWLANMGVRAYRLFGPGGDGVLRPSPALQALAHQESKVRKGQVSLEFEDGRAFLKDAEGNMEPYLASSIMMTPTILTRSISHEA